MEKYRSANIALNTTILEFPNTKYKEEVLFLILKSNFLFASNSVNSKKIMRFEESIKSYYTFVDSFKNSKFAKEALKWNPKYNDISDIINSAWLWHNSQQCLNLC